MLTQEKLKILLHYDAETGIFTNRITRGSRSVAGNITGSEDVYGYWIIHIESRPYKAHRLAWLYMTGAWPKGDIDHINELKCDNRFVNLREVNRSKNVSNQGPMVNNYLQIRGVYMDRNKFRVSKSINGIRYNLGTYDTLDEARRIAEDFSNGL